MCALTAPQPPTHPVPHSNSHTTRRSHFSFSLYCQAAEGVCFILKMRHTYLPLKQRQPKRAAGATMLMLSGALTSPSHCKDAAPCDSHGSPALPPVLAIYPSPPHFGRCVGKKKKKRRKKRKKERKKKPDRVLSVNLKPLRAVKWTRRISWT